ncbi:MAG TPA: tannase/feruloyl esterase family alpha/beta hydrolase [Gammaproteobacteria bacterium]
MLKYLSLSPVLAAFAHAAVAQAQTQTPADAAAACEALVEMRNVTITRAVVKPATGDVPAHCYVVGNIGGRIRFHMQLPFPQDWNGRLLNIGDGGKDGQLNFADDRLAQGYAVANSNTGHDSGAEPGASFAHEDLQAVIDFGYRAVHLTANASKAIVREYYGRPQRYAYFEGCSTGGRQGLMEAQRYPADFDGIVAGAPVFDYQRLNATHVWMVQQIFADDFSGNLAYDADGNGVPESLTKWRILRDAVMAKCDAVDGLRDGLIDDPRQCDFDPARDLAGHMCPSDVNADDCFTRRQVETIAAIYRGPHDSKGERIFKGMDLGSEWNWDRTLVAHEGNRMLPAKLIYGLDHVNFLFYEKSPGVPMPDPVDVKQKPDKSANPPEFAWWEFDIDDVTAGAGDFMMSITDATNPDLSRFLSREGGKLLLYHGWADPEGQAEPTLDYYERVVETTFDGDFDAARDKVRLFMIPGMGHCRGGPGPSEWDRLAPLVDWVENGVAPDYLVVQRRTSGAVDMERRVCAHPQRAVYVGPERDRDEPARWRAESFECR